MRRWIELCRICPCSMRQWTKWRWNLGMNRINTERESRNSLKEWLCVSRRSLHFRIRKKRLFSQVLHNMLWNITSQQSRNPHCSRISSKSIQFSNSKLILDIIYEMISSKLENLSIKAGLKMPIRLTRLPLVNFIPDKKLPSKTGSFH